MKITLRGISLFLTLLLLSSSPLLLTACDGGKPDPYLPGEDTLTSEQEEDSTDATESQTTKETEEEVDDLPPKSIDLYFIAGQSNGAGCTKITDRAEAYLFAPELEDGYSHVHYSGNSRSNSSGVRNRVLSWRPTRLGYGITNDNYVGPEAGMAKALSSVYNSETDRHAGIIKYAYGGSSLLNLTSGSTHMDGNWVSPSYEATLPAGTVTSATGRMYDNFLAQVKSSVESLRAYGGFTEVRVCGLYWMQGCANKSNPTEYAKAFAYFASDLRRDLSALMIELTGEDCGASTLPIVVGTISETQNLQNEGTLAINRAFIEMQKSLPNTVEHCTVVDHSALPITEIVDGKVQVVGSDQWHWKQADMLTVGYDAGTALLRPYLS